MGSSDNQQPRRAARAIPKAPQTRIHVVAGDQVSAEARGVLGIKDFTGEVVFASRQHGADCTVGDAGHMQYKVHKRDLVPLGSRTGISNTAEVLHMVPLWWLLACMQRR